MTLKTTDVSADLPHLRLTPAVALTFDLPPSGSSCPVGDSCATPVQQLLSSLDVQVDGSSVDVLG